MDPTASFAAEVAHGAWPLDRLAALIAAHARPVDPDEVGRALDRLAADVPASAASAVMAHLFGSGRFRGNTLDYYDPDNSFIDQVLDKGLGIPITLSLLAVEVARRHGTALVLIGMPGHVLVRDRSDPTTFWDPFDGGRRLDLAGVETRFRAIHGPGVPFDAAMTRPTPKPAIIERILGNLAAVYAARRDAESMAWVARLQSMVAGAERGAAPLN